MVVGVDRFVEDVRVALDMNAADGALGGLEDSDTLTLDQIITSKIEEAIDKVHMAAPVHMLEQGHNFGDAVYWGSEGRGWVILPEDFLRLIVFEMSDWERAAYTAIAPEGEEYARQRGRVKALRGVPQRPVVAIVNRPVGLVLEFYSCKDNTALVQRAMYIPRAKVEAGSVDVSERCYRAAVYMIAALVLGIYGDKERAAAMEAEAARCEM